MTTLLKGGNTRERALQALLGLIGVTLCHAAAAGDDSDSQAFLEQLGDNQAQILESGDDNRISVHQINVTGSNRAVIALDGEDNRAHLEQRGGFLTAVVTFDEGEDNRASLRQRGEHSRLSVLLDGGRNRFDVDQGVTRDASALALNVSVSGYGNRGMLSQAGSGHSMAVAVVGAGNGIFARQR